MKTTAQHRWLTSWHPSSLAAFCETMAEADRRGSSFVLDLSDRTLAGAGKASAVRLELLSIMVLSNLLTSRFRHVPIQVRVPDNPGLSVQLTRGGLFFALAARPGVSWMDGTPSSWDQVARAWSEPFDPDDVRMFREALVTRHDLARDSWVVRAAFQRYLLSVVHPHRRPAATLRSDLDTMALRWLSGRLEARDKRDLESTLSECAEVFYELMVNVPDHAGLGANPIGASLGQLFATLGGGTDSHNRLHFSVMDNGVGIWARVQTLHADQQRDAPTAVRDAATGMLPARGPGRGGGLQRVHEITAHYATMLRGRDTRGGLRIVTTGDTSDAAVHLDWGAGATNPRVESLAGLPVRGTIVYASLGLERCTSERDSADQLELRFEEANSLVLATTD